MADPNFDFESVLNSILDQNRQRQEALAAEIEAKRAEQDALLNSSEEDWGSVGNALLSGLASYAGGALGGESSIGQAFVDAGTSGTGYYKNLEAQEKAKYDAIGAEISDMRILNRDILDNSQATTGVGVQLAGNLAQQNMLGNIPGTPQADLAQRDKVELARETAAARDIVMSDEAADAAGLPRGTTLREAGILQRDQGLEQKRTEESRRQLGMKQKLESAKRMGYEFINPPRDKDIERASKLKEDYDVWTGVKRDMMKELQENGVSWFGVEGKRQDELWARLIDGYRNNSGSGANFTLLEFNLADKRVTDNEFIANIKARLRGYGDAESIIENLAMAMESDKKAYAEGLVSRNALLPGYAYDPEYAAQNGIPLDAQGRAMPTGAIDRSLGEIDALMKNNQQVVPGATPTSTPAPGGGSAPERPMPRSYKSAKEYSAAMLDYYRAGGK